VGVDDVSIVLTKQRLGRGSYAKTLFKLFASAVGDPCNLRRKSLDVLLFLVQKAFRYEHGHAYVLVTQLLKTAVEDFLHVLPYCVAVRADDHASLYACVFYKLRFFDYVCVPLSKVLA